MIRFLIIIATGVTALLCSCSNQASDSSKPVARVNQYVISSDDFRQALARSANLHDIVGLSIADKKSILDDEIRKELFIQEAINQGLDKDAEFRQTIERYWQQTLIASLIKRQCAALDTGIIVNEEEIEKRFKQIVQPGKESPVLTTELRRELEKEIRDEKQTKALEDWTENLFKKANITIYEENLAPLR